METIKEISSISAFKPASGDLSRLFALSMKEDISKKEVSTKFKNGEKTDNHFYVTLSHLKSNLVNGIFLNSFKDYSKYNQAQFKILKNLTASKILIKSEKLNAGIDLANKTLKQAEHYGLISESLELNRALETIYSKRISEKKKYFRYKEKVSKLMQLLVDETKVQSLFNEVVFLYLTNSNYKHLKDQIKALIEPTENKEYKYNLFRFSTIHLYFHLEGDIVQEVKTCKTALHFFDTHYKTQPLPFTTKYHFQIQLVRHYLSIKDFANAEKSIRYCLELPTKGGYNWHQALFYLALLGFHSNKPQITFNAWHLANKTPKKFQSPAITERWKIIRAYLGWYAKLGKISIPENFRLGKFLNEVTKSGQDKEGLNVSIIIIQLLHLLTTGNKKLFMEKVDTLNGYIHTHLKGKANKRNKAFLKMLSKIDQANYHKVRLDLMTKTWRKQLKQNPTSISINMIDSEVIPFEIIWEEIQQFLK